MKTAFILFFLLFALPLVSAQTVSIGDYSTAIDSEVTVLINISDAESVAGGMVNISFDPSILSVEHVGAGDFGDPVANINNISGWVKLVAARADNVNKNEAVLANIVFNGSSNGTSALTIEYASLNNETGALITPLTSNGKIVVSLSLDDTSPPSSISDLVSDSGSSWINWTWTNPSDSDFNHTMVYLDGKFVDSTSNQYFNATDLLQGTLHTISTRTVDLSGNVNETWVNDTAMTNGELLGGLSIKISKPSSYSFYPVGETVEFNAAVTDQNGNPVTSGISAYADLSGPDSTSKRIIMSEDGGNFVGEYTVKRDDARGIWTVNINAFNATSSGQASLQLFFTGAYFIQPYTDSRSYLLGETANFTAKVVKPVGSSQPLTDKNLSLNLSVYLFNTTILVSGPVEMVFNDTTGKFHGDVNTGLLGSGLFSVVFSGNDTDGNIETESLTIGVSEDFNIIVDTDKTCYDRNEPVNIHGSMEFIDGSPLSNTDVNLRISLKGFMRSYTATTNETGGFNYTFQPFAAEAGNYTITSTAVNLGLQRTAENHFTIHGLYLAPPSGTLNMVENSSQDIDFILYNLGETTLTGITAVVNDLDISDNVDATIITTVPNELQSSESAYITLNVSAGTPVPENATFFITVSTDQMSDETSELDVNLFSPNPVVVLEPDNIAVGLNQNQTALKTVTISNTGYGVLRNLTLTQPGYNWMRINSNTTIGDLKPGENTSFDIHIHSYNVSLRTYHDTVGITSDNHESMVVDLSASITDQTYGSLLFYVENELGQNISGASISLIDDTLYQEYTATTNSTGYALINDLPTGRYIYEVSSSSDNTLSQLNSVVVEPMEQPRRVNVTMQLSFINFEWDVIPSTIDDWYQIVLNMTFETDVPVPIIVAFPPHLEYNMNPGDVQSGTLTVANLGLVSLFDVSITPYINNNVQFTPIVSHIEELKAKSSVQIPYTIELAPSASSCDGFTGKISIKGKYIHFINGEGVASYTGTTVPLVVKTPTCEPPEIGIGTLTGTVTDASNGSQIDNARVVAHSYSDYTDSSGSYTLASVRSGTYTITAYKDGYYPISKTVVVTKDTIETVNFQLTPITTGPIIGIVTNAIDGTPIEGARVVAGGRSDATDDSGSYTLSEILTGSHTITASKRGFYTSSTTVLVTEDNTAVVNFQLTPIPETVVLTGSVSGTVTDIDSGEALPFALVVTNGGFDFTDESGSYTITGVPVGSNNVIASKTWYHSASKTVHVYEDCTTIVNFQLKKIIIPPIPVPDCECITGTPPVIWVYKGPDFGLLTPPPTTPSKMFVKNCNEEGTIEFGDAWGATISLTSLWTSSLLANIGMSSLSAFDIPVEIWYNEFIPEQIDPNEETMLDVENMGRFFSDMESFGITLPIPDIFGGALGFVYGPYPYDASRNCLKIIPLGGMEIKEGSINIVFPPFPPWPPWPDGDSDDGPDPVPPWRPPVFTETIHEIVQLSISQNATMERDAFWAGLGIRNRMPDMNIDNVGVSLHISNENESANHKFFIRAPRLDGISDIDGSGTISPLQLAKAQWLIIPKPGAGGVSGQTYNISADITYSVDGTNFRVTTENVEILVNPQPQLILDYYLPSDVIGNSPFKLAVMVTNDGYGTARNFSIETAQPVIYNPSGLMIDFEIIRSALQGEERSDSLKINFGDLSPGESKLAWWEMVVSMDGTFTEFIGDYTHSSELGGMETSLIKQLNTNIIHREIETGDVNYSFLVTPKDDETHYLLLDSNSGGSTPVSIANYTIVSGPTPSNPNLNVNIEDLTGQWVIVSIEDPYDNKVPILKVIRDSDDSEIPFYNYWMRDERILIVDHYTEGFDGKYSIQFDYPLILDTTFRPNPNGYQFANFGSDNYSWEIFRITYGADEVEVDGQSLPRALNFSEKYYRHAGKNGSCFGMSASSLLLYHNNLKSWDLAGQTSSINPGRNRSLDSADSCIGGIPIPPDFNDNGVCDPSPRTWGVFSQFMSTPTDWVEYYQPLQYSATSLADRAKFKGPITVYNELKLRMVSGNWIGDPMVIGIEWKKTDGNITGHAVVPYRIEEAPDHMSGEVFIYDSVYPDSERSIQFDLVTGTARDSDWTLNNLSNVAAVSLSAIQSEPQIPEGFESVTSHGHLLYTDSIERHLGYYGGEFKDEIPNTSRIIPYGQIKGDQNPETYYISNLQLKRELYGIDDGIATVSILRPNTLIVADVQVSPGSVDELLVPLDGSSVEFISGGGTSLLSLMLDREKTDFARLASINVSGIESGSAIQLLFSDDLGKVGVINNGLQNGYTIYLEQIGLNHSSYRSPRPVIIEETSSAWFIPSNWNDIPNNPIVVEHDIGNDGTIDYTEILPSQDTTPPAGIANLQHTAATTYLNWTWTDPTDLDFNHTEIYFNTFFQTNVIKGVHHFNATELDPDTSYEIGTRTVDTNGNTNLTWVNNTATTLPLPDIIPPIITITSLVNNITYNIDSVNLNYSVNEPTTWQGYSLDGAANITLQENITLTNLTDGLHTLTVYANDTSGNMNLSTVWFTIDTKPPVINTVTLNTTTPTPGEDIIVTVNTTDNIAVTSVTTNGIELTHKGENIWNEIITAIEGTHSVNISASDAAVNIAWNNSTSYTATTPDTTPPSPTTNLHPTPSTTWLNVTWTNPSDPDFNHTKLYLNGTFLTNIPAPQNYYNITELLPDTSYELSTRTVDTSGNINKTWVNATACTLPLADTTPPIITINSPMNDTLYTTDLVELNYSVNEPTIWEGYSLDGAYNISLFGNTTLFGLNDGLHILNVYANDTSGNMNSSTIWFTIDTLPPSGITDLQHTAGRTWINWTWTNPFDPDFNHTEIYLNGTFLTNILAMQDYYNITGLLPDTSYELSTRTVDINGNINETWVNGTAHTFSVSDDTPPTITFILPTDPSGITLTTRNWTFINVSLSEPGLSWLEWNGINESMAGSDTNWYINKTDLVNGVYTYRVWANDTAGNENVSETRTIEIDYINDNLPPIISITSPMNDTLYTTDSVELNYSVNEPTIWEGYSLDGADNITLFGNTMLFGLNDGSHLLTIYANDTSGIMNSSSVWFATDTTPPSNISSLMHTVGITWINWTWTNPSDPDFNHTELYLNGTFLTNIPAPQNYYNATGLLPDALYELSTRTVDTAGNINETWVNDTARTLPLADTTPPIITFIPPTDPGDITLITRNWTFINVSLSEPGFSWLEWNGINESMSGSGTHWYINKTGLDNGVYSYCVWANDSAGNVNVSVTRAIEIDYVSDTLPPIVAIISPVNDTTYNADSVNLNYSVNEPAVWQGYSLDGSANITLDGNTTLTDLIDGLHTLTVYANDTSGNMNSSTIWFTIDATSPIINTASLNTTTPDAGEDILVTVNATDDTAVISVVANDVVLVPQGGDIWSGTITAIAGTHTVNVSATDTAGNIGWNNSTSYTATTQDTIPPLVEMVTLNTTTPDAGKDILVIVNATDNAAVISVVANDVVLVPQGGDIWSGTITAIAGTHTVNVSATDTADNIGWNNSTSYTATTQDTTPPAIISNLHHNSGTTWINWTWTNPPDPDFNHTEIYLNGIFQTNKSAEFFNATGLIPNTEYEISTRTADNLGNINETWVNDTAMTLDTPPVSNASGPYTGIEGQAIIFNASASYDPDPGEYITSFEWDFNNDGSTDATGMEVSWTWNDDYAGQVNLTVTDSHGESSIDTTSVNVLNAPPEVKAGNDHTVNEGDIISFSGSFTDPGTADTHLIEWDFGDGTQISSGTLTPTHTYADNGTYTVNLTVTDDDGASTSDTLIVTVNNVAPVLDEDADQTVQWGDTMTFSRSFTDPGDDSWTAEIDWGDGSQEEGILSSKIITATHVYSIPGEYTYTLTVLDDDGGVGSGDMQIIVTTRATELEYIGDLSAQYSDYINLKAQLNDPGNNNPIPDRSISFILGTQTAIATTGPDGTATASFKFDQPAGSYDIKAEFAGDESYSPDSNTKAVQISREDTEITYTGDAILPITAGSIDLRATLEEIDTDYGDLTKINVNFNIYKSSDLSYSNPIATVPSVASISVTSSGMGVGTATATIDNLPEDDYMIIARIVPNDYYLPMSSNPTPMIVYEPTGQFTTGGGWIWDPTGSHGNFGFNVRYNKKGKVKGNSIYVYRLDGLDYIVKSNAWIGLAINDNTSTFQGKAVLQIFDPVTGELQPESSGNFQFTVEAKDNELNGNPDYYKITVLDKEGLEYHNATGSLEGGNIVIHDKKSK